MSNNGPDKETPEPRRREMLQERPEQAERDSAARGTRIRIDDIRVLVRDGEFIFTLAQLLTPEQRSELDRYWLAQPPEAVEAATDAIERLYHDTLGYPPPTLDPRTATIKFYRKRS